MRLHIRIALGALIVALIALVIFQRVSQMNGRFLASSTILPSTPNLSILQNALRNSAYSPDESASMLFLIFARHVKPGMSPQEVFDTIGSSGWLSRISFVERSFQSSGPPMFPGASQSDVELLVKPFAGGAHDGHITFWFSGPMVHGDFQDYFSNSYTGGAKLLGFALHIPHPLKKGSVWRTEIYTRNQFRVQEYWN